MYSSMEKENKKTLLEKVHSAIFLRLNNKVLKQLSKK